jgi:N utilization substance protein B
MGIRRDARKIAVRALYIIDVLELTEQEAWQILDSDSKAEKAFEFAVKLVSGTMKNIDFIDERILHHTKNWELDRIADVDKAIIRMGLYEIYFEDSIPRNASINEAIELAKHFSTAKSHKFVNGILDSSTSEIEKKENKNRKNA